MRPICQRLIAFVLILMVLSISMLSMPGNVQAGALITVTTTKDEYTANGNCSLREAVIAANENRPVDKCPAGSASSMDSIFVPAGIYFLTILGPGEDASRSGDLDILGSVSIYGAGSGSGGTQIDGVNLGDRVFHTLSKGEVSLNSIEILSGLVSGNGGGLYNVGTGPVHVSNVLFFNNQASNTGGNIANSVGSTMYVARSTVSKGSAKHGGGIYNRGTLFVTESLLVDNLAGESGGGIDNNTDTAILTLTNSTLAQNNATFSNGQQGTAGGAAVFSDGVIQISNSTIVKNTGIGLILSSSSSGYILNSIIAGNTGGNCDPTLVDTKVQDAEFNLLDSTDCKFMGHGADKVVSGWDALKLADKLAYNGGPTQTFALLDGSPAIDAGSPDCALLVDQRYHIRPWSGVAGNGRRVDIGAYEFGAPAGGLYLPFIRNK